MPKVYITAHRGMGVTAKKRHELIKDAEFYPENSIAAFRKAISLGADALECDIHVSNDKVALVIHGDTIASYATVDEGSKIKTKDKKCSNFNLEEIKKHFTLINNNNSAVSMDDEFKRIPTLIELLSLAADENEKRAKVGRESLKLNIELKGKDSGFISLATISAFNAARKKENKYPIDPNDIIMLGKIDVCEITIVKNILNISEDYSFVKDPTDRTLKLHALFAHDELGKHFIKKGWSFFLINDEPMDDEDLSGYYLPEKAVLLSASNNVFFAKKGSLVKAFKNRSLQPRSIKIDSAKYPKRFLIEKILANNLLELEEIIQDLLLEFNLDKESHHEIPQYYSSTNILKRIIDFQYMLCKDKDKDSTVKKMNVKASEIYLDLFLDSVKDLKRIQTNVMISSGELYGTRALLEKSEDFDIRPDIITIPNSGYRLILDCFKYGYDGIDISLFDFDERIYQAILEGMAIRNSSTSAKGFIMGVTASNWRGAVSEKSPVEPLDAIMKTMLVATRLKTSVLIKVDEPGLFKELQKIVSFILEGSEESEKVILSTEIVYSHDEVESERTIIAQGSSETLCEEALIYLRNIGYDVDAKGSIGKIVDMAKDISGTSIVRSLKPPRGTSKEFNDIPYSIWKPLCGPLKYITSPLNIKNEKLLWTWNRRLEEEKYYKERYYGREAIVLFRGT
jgi:glycerophosphoryl diester phosphodiesterase